MSTSSDQYMSESSNSPASYTTLESPQSSPLQQVPQLTSSLSGLSCTEKNLYTTKNGNVPFLKITEQPQSHFRFRYDTEKSGSTHGSIVGKSYVENKRNKKTHPTVQLVNYSGKAVITCSIKYACDDKNVHKNIYKILEDEQNSKSYTVPKSKSYKVGFPGIGIHTIKKTHLSELLYKKLSEPARKNSVNTAELRDECDKLSKSIDQNIVRLKFTAHDADTGKEICDPVLSDPILNKKCSATNALKICRMSIFSGRPSGADDIFLLVDKIDKNDIKVRFYEKNENGKQVWSAWGVFIPSDVHYQSAIVCRTPPYIDVQTPGDVKVWVELVRPSNGSTSDPQPFVYKADPVYRQYKRRKMAMPCASRTETNFSGGSLIMDQPVIVLPNEPVEHRVESEAPQLAIQPTSESEWNIISTTLDILENGPGQALELQETPSPMWGPCHLTGQPLPAALGIAAPSALPSLGELVIAATPAQPLSTEHMPEDVVIEGDIFENALTEYAGLFDMSFDDFFQSATENNGLVGDSGRVKEEPSTSSPEAKVDAADAGSDENDVPASQAVGEGLTVTGTGDCGTSQGGTETLLATGASSGAGAGASTPADKAIERAGSESPDVKASADSPALFTADDAAEVKKLVRALCETIRDKSSKSDSVRANLERLFDIRLSNGDTFLHMTLFKNQPSFEALVKMIDSVKMPHLLNYANNRGETILHLAVIHGTPALVALLVAKGCDVAARNCEEESALHYAVRYAGADTLRALLHAAERAGVPLDLDAANAEGVSALHLCALHGRARCAALLGERGASCGARDAAGRTPLHLCAYDARADVARALLPHAGADVDARDGGGRTPLAVACAREPSPPALELARALLAAGARAEHAWRAARDRPALQDLLRAHMPDQEVSELKLEPDDHEDPDADADEDAEADAEEYESAEDEFFDVLETPESLAGKLKNMGLTDDAQS